MGYTWKQKIKNFICKIFGHFTVGQWVHNDVKHGNCWICGKLVSLIDNKWVDKG